MADAPPSPALCGMSNERSRHVRPTLAEVSGRIEEMRDRFAAEHVVDARLVFENVAQMRALRTGAPTGARNERMRGVAAHRRRERHLYRLREDEPVREIEVRAHAVDVDVET